MQLVNTLTQWPIVSLRSIPVTMFTNSDNVTKARHPMGTNRRHPVYIYSFTLFNVCMHSVVRWCRCGVHPLGIYRVQWVPHLTGIIKGLAGHRTTEGCKDRHGKEKHSELCILEFRKRTKKDVQLNTGYRKGKKKLLRQKILHTGFPTPQRSYLASTGLSPNCLIIQQLVFHDLEVGSV